RYFFIFPLSFYYWQWQWSYFDLILLMLPMNFTGNVSPICYWSAPYLPVLRSLWGCFYPKKKAIPATYYSGISGRALVFSIFPDSFTGPEIKAGIRLRLPDRALYCPFFSSWERDILAPY